MTEKSEKERPRTLIIKPINPVDTRAFVVPSEDEKVFWVLDLVGEQETDGLEGLLAAIDVIAEEEVVCFWRETAVLEQSEEVVVLAVDVTYITNTSTDKNTRKKL